MTSKQSVLLGTVWHGAKVARGKCFRLCLIALCNARLLCRALLVLPLEKLLERQLRAATRTVPKMLGELKDRRGSIDMVATAAYLNLSKCTA